MSNPITVVLLVLLLAFALLVGCTVEGPPSPHKEREEVQDAERPAEILSAELLPGSDEEDEPQPSEEDARELKPAEEKEGEPEGEEVPITDRNDGENMDFETIDLRTLEGYLKEKLGGDHPEQGLITVEDGGYKYILVSAGQKPTAGYSVAVESVLGYEDSIAINARLYSPGPEDMVATVITYPSTLIRIPADERGVILFLKDAKAISLGP